MGKNKQFSVAQIRDTWFSFFEKHGHKRIESASLVPAGDPTLLFTTAGMVQFKPYFAGTAEPPHPRLVSLQKCLRTTDLEEVGKTDRHCTFFEMLGNFSFGDYFKEGAIELAWEFSLKELGLKPEEIYITVYEKDDESVELWKKTGVPEERITRLGKKDNFWGPAGDSGACGPCSELYLDRGPEHCTCDNKGSCKPGDECDRYMEYWNLVFNEFYQDTSGKQTPLPKTGIDTGAGLERLAALLGGFDSVYDTDEMARIIKRIEELSSELREDKKSIKYDISTNPAPFRVITDHVRAASFAIADGIYPDNTGRGYVIRRLIRRALLFARELGIYTGILHRLVDLVVEIYGAYYPELAKNQDSIRERIRMEEERFLRTLEQGLLHWQEFLDEHRKKEAAVFSGEAAFVLYDTYGFPVEMTRELAEKEGLAFDEEGFDLAMTEQRERSRKKSDWKASTLPSDLGLPEGFETEFLGYESSSCKSRVLALVDPGGRAVQELAVEGPSRDGAILVILDKTVFYAEGGGQLGDAGLLQGEDTIFSVTDTQRLSGVVVHIGHLKSGSLRVGQELEASTNQDRRLRLTQHHSATHLLNSALRKNLGDHISQTGSLVAPDYLRFDFSHPRRLEEGELARIESDVLAAIASAEPVRARVLPKEEASRLGAVAAFGEKYGDEVRVVSMGREAELSIEFCGGCHVSNTKDIGLFHIIKEGSPGAGNRRIEALAGEAVIRHFQAEIDKRLSELDICRSAVLEATQGDQEAAKRLLPQVELPAESASQLLKKPMDVLRLAEALEKAALAIAAAQKALLKYKKDKKKSGAKSLLSKVDDYIAQARKMGDISVVRVEESGADGAALRQLADRIREKMRGVVVLAASDGDGKKPLLLFAADKKAVESGVNSSELIRKAAFVIGGGGGGRPDMAQAGGKDASKISEALDLAESALSS